MLNEAKRRFSLNRIQEERDMCDFAADAKAAEELMVGRTLTVARVRELNAKDYFYQMRGKVEENWRTQCVPGC